jgi:hypothetical protein
MLSRKSTLVLLVAMVLVASVMFFVAATPASAQKTIPTPIQLTATPTETVAPTATAVPPTATKVPPTATAVPPTATKVPPTATKVPPTATKVPPTATQPAPKRASPSFQFTYSAGTTAQNLSNSAVASISITYYNQDGTVNATVTDTIPALSNKTYYPTNSMNGSAVISSDQPLAAIVNVLGNSGVVGTAYGGSSQGSTTAYVPILMKNNYGFNTWFNVQNAGSSATTVTANYSDGTTASQSINPGASKTFDQATETHTPKTFAATLTSTGSQPIVVTVVEENSTTLSSYSGFASGSTNPVMPIINANNYGVVTGVSIQNAGSVATNVTVSYTPSAAGTACTETISIPAGAVKNFALNAFTNTPQTPGTTCTLGQKFVGSGQVTANSASQPLVAIVNQANGTKNADAYNAFDPNTGTQKVFFPQIFDRYYGINSDINVMNVGSGSTTVTCTFTGSAHTKSQTLAPGQSLYELEKNLIANSYLGAATCTATNSGDKIVGMSDILSSVTTDGFSDYDGFNQ